MAQTTRSACLATLLLLLANISHADMSKCPDTPLPEVTPTWAEAEITASRLLAPNQTALAGLTPELSPDGRTRFTLSCDGWVQKFDIRSLQVEGRVRAGLNPRNMVIGQVVAEF